MRAVFVDAVEALAEVAERMLRVPGVDFVIHREPRILPASLPAVLDGAEIALIDHTALPTGIARRCPALKHVVFLGTGAASYMDVEGLAALGISVHTIKGYGDTAVAEHAFALMWAAAKDLGRMDGEIRRGIWRQGDSLQLTGKTLGLIGFGGIGAEMARLALGVGMKVQAWNRTPKTVPGVAFVEIDRLLATSDVVSLHLLLGNETRGFLSRQRLALLKPGAILVNTARGALIDESAMIEALTSGRLGHAALDVFVTEPLPAEHPLARLANVTLSAHSAFRTPEASENLIAGALDHCRHIAA